MLETYLRKHLQSGTAPCGHIVHARKQDDGTVIIEIQPFDPVGDDCMDGTEFIIREDQAEEIVRPSCEED
jgi:hypothetical protein